MVLRGLLVGTVLVGIGVAFAACSDDPPGLGGDGGSTPTSTTTTTTPRPSTTTTSTTPPFPTGTSTTPPPPDAAVPDSSVADSSRPDASDGAVAPTFTQVYAVFSTGNKCTGCHGATHPTGLAMANQALAYTNLFDKLCGAGGAGMCANGARKRVVANNAVASILYHKVAAKRAGSGVTVACADPMPPGARTALSAAEILMVRDWINAGALNN